MSDFSADPGDQHALIIERVAFLLGETTVAIHSMGDVRRASRERSMRETTDTLSTGSRSRQPTKQKHHRRNQLPRRHEDKSHRFQSPGTVLYSHAHITPGLPPTCRPRILQSTNHPHGSGIDRRVISDTEVAGDHSGFRVLPPSRSLPQSAASHELGWPIGGVN